MALTTMSAVIAWLPMIDLILRIGVSAVGIVAGLYAAFYWRKKIKLADSGKDRNEL